MIFDFNILVEYIVKIRSIEQALAYFWVISHSSFIFSFTVSSLVDTYSISSGMRYILTSFLLSVTLYRSLPPHVPAANIFLCESKNMYTWFIFTYIGKAFACNKI